MDPHSQNDLLTSVEAARLLGMKPTTLRDARWRGELAGVQPPPYRRIGRAVRYPRAALDHWLAQFPEQTSSRDQGNSSRSAEVTA